MFCDVGREAGHHCALVGQRLALVAARNLARQRRKPASDASQTPYKLRRARSSGAAFKPAALWQNEAPGFRAAVTRRQTMLHRCGTGGMCRGLPLDSRHSSWASLLSDEATSNCTAAHGPQRARERSSTAHRTRTLFSQPQRANRARIGPRRGVNKAFSESCHQSATAPRNHEDRQMSAKRRPNLHTVTAWRNG